MALRLPYDAWEPIVEALWALSDDDQVDQPWDTRTFTRDVGSLSSTCNYLRQRLGVFLYKEILLSGPHAKDPTARNFRMERHKLSAAGHTINQLKEQPGLRSIVTHISLRHWMCHIQFTSEQEHLPHQQTLADIWPLLPNLHNLTRLDLVAVAISSEGHDALRHLSSVRELVLDDCSIWPCTEGVPAQTSLLCLERLYLKSLEWHGAEQPSSFSNSSRLRRLETNSVTLLHAVHYDMVLRRGPSKLSELILRDYMVFGEELPGVSGAAQLPGLIEGLLACCPGLLRLHLREEWSFPMLGLCPRLHYLTASIELVTDAVRQRGLPEIDVVENDHVGGAPVALPDLVAAICKHQPPVTTSFMYVGDSGFKYATVLDVCAPLLPHLYKFGISGMQMGDTIGDVFQAVRRHSTKLARVQEMHFSCYAPDVDGDDVTALLALCAELQPVCPDLWKVGIGYSLDCVLEDDGEWRIVHAQV